MEIITLALDEYIKLLGVDPRGKTRRREMAYMRFAFCEAARTEMPELSLREIGSLFCRDHSTVIHSIKVMKEAIEADWRDPQTLRLIEYNDMAREIIRDCVDNSDNLTPTYGEDRMNEMLKYLSDVNEKSMLRIQNLERTVYRKQELINKYKDVIKSLEAELESKGKEIKYLNKAEENEMKRLAAIGTQTRILKKNKITDYF